MLQNNIPSGVRPVTFLARVIELLALILDPAGTCTDDE